MCAIFPWRQSVRVTALSDSVRRDFSLCHILSRSLSVGEEGQGRIWPSRAWAFAVQHRVTKGHTLELSLAKDRRHNGRKECYRIASHPRVWGQGQGESSEGAVSNPGPSCIRLWKHATPPLLIITLTRNIPNNTLCVYHLILRTSF